MKAQTFELSISYSQFGVFDRTIENPFNDWSDGHVTQGFSWRPESACFRTPSGDGRYVFEVWVAHDPPSIDESVRRAIVVPCPKRITAEIEIASIGDSHVLDMSTRRDSLLVEFLSSGSQEVPLVRLTFYSEGDTVFRIAKADSAEMTRARLLTTASVA